MCLEFGVVHAEVRVVIGVHVRGVLVQQLIDDNLAGLADPGEGHPVVVALVEVLEVRVVVVGVIVFAISCMIIYNSFQKKKERISNSFKQNYLSTVCSPGYAP